LTPITCAASSWATLSLARLAPLDKPASKADSARDGRPTVLLLPANRAGGTVSCRAR
jgi:hypothetical protein